MGNGITCWILHGTRSVSSRGRVNGAELMTRTTRIYTKTAHRICRLRIIALALLLTTGGALGKPPKSGSEPVLLVVMDPLAKELACACVKGYGQRDYRKVAKRLEKAIRQHVTIEFSDDLAESMAGVSPGREVIVVGDQSLVAAGAKKAGLKFHPVCELTDPDGS